MTKGPNPDVERRALALFERLVDQPGNLRLRARLLRNEPAAVLSRLADLEASLAPAQGFLPTLIPGSADCDGMIPPPEQIGPFRLLECVGRGGMGDVWRAERRDALFAQTVAVKLIQRHALSRAGKAFDDERRFLARLEHPNIARLIDGGVTEDGLPWIAMEFVDGQPIDIACAGKDERDCVDLLIKVADAVHYAHGMLVAHADLKPANMLVDRNGRVKLLDFGISGLIGEDGDRQTVGPLTRAFASPERQAGAPPSVGDDVYALGKTLAHILPTKHGRELDAIAAKASRADPSDRYDSAASFIADLDRWRKRRVVRAMPDVPIYRIRKFVQRNPMLVSISILLAATGGVAALNYIRAETASERSSQRMTEVRQLARYLLNDLYNDLAKQPGTLNKRVEIAEVGARYLDQLRTARDAPDDLKLEVAEGYRRLAIIQGLGGGINLGRLDDARRSLDLAKTLTDELVREQPRNAGALAERGWVALGYWALSADNAEGLALNKAAGEWVGKALAVEPRLPSARLAAVIVDRNRMFDLIWAQDKPADAIPIGRAALARLRAMRWPKALQEQADQQEINLLNRLGDATYYAGDVKGSLPFYGEANQVVTRLIKRDGPVPVWLLAKAEVAFNRSGTLQELDGRMSEALRVAEEGLADIRIAMQFGEDAGTEKRLLILLSQKGNLLTAMGRSKEAVVPSAESVEIRRRRLRQSATDPQRMRDLAVSLTPHAKVLRAAGDRTQSCTIAREAAALWQDMRRRGVLSAKDAADELPQSETVAKDFCNS